MCKVMNTFIIIFIFFGTTFIIIIENVYLHLDLDCPVSEVGTAFFSWARIFADWVPSPGTASAPSSGS
ncbi:hypothetical protein BpHYR1_008610 [Brachionus plicatilis]|uniref:Uncharacterized protein n=1 Tax=Brachionus plicatilis TaxID=10195 RepID=A0A3M7R9W3_BRAPC|nr:hypothetical protein BpHYR1_008610 [Brachionus plicatilis]